MITGFISSWIFFKLENTWPGEGIITISLLNPVYSSKSKLPSSVENNESISRP